jgi:hypothetical protein
VGVGRWFAPTIGPGSKLPRENAISRLLRPDLRKAGDGH